ncbi:MAG: family 10 glycosylhydrolase [Candidatus Omnitrophota bacterium]
MKKVLILFYILCAVCLPQTAAAEKVVVPRYLFVSVIQDPSVLSSRQAIEDLIVFAQRAGIKMLFVQVYRANRAWFLTSIADTKPYQECYKSVSGDPFALLIKKAHAAGIEVHAWVNLLTLSTNEEAPILKKYGTTVLTRNKVVKTKLQDYKIDNQYFLEPSDRRVRADLSTLLDDLLRRYPELDGVQFDYIRYPDTKPFYGYSKDNITRFKKVTGKRVVTEEDKAWKDWKRHEVTELLTALVARARKLKPGIKISATGCMPYTRAYHEALQDWPGWLNHGLVDFVTTMSYSPEPVEFAAWITYVKTKVSDFRKVIIGVGAYKLLRSPEVFREEIKICEGLGAGACAIFHYGSLLEGSALSTVLVRPGPPGITLKRTKTLRR